MLLDGSCGCARRRKAPARQRRAACKDPRGRYGPSSASGQMTCVGTLSIESAFFAPRLLLPFRNVAAHLVVQLNESSASRDSACQCASSACLIHLQLTPSSWLRLSTSLRGSSPQNGIERNEEQRVQFRIEGNCTKWFDSTMRGVFGKGPAPALNLAHWITYRSLKEVIL